MTAVQSIPNLQSPDAVVLIDPATGLPYNGSSGTQSFVDRGTINAGAGPYALSHSYTASSVTVTLDGLEQLPANYSVTATQLTFVGLTMTDYLNWSLRGNY